MIESKVLFNLRQFQRSVHKSLPSLKPLREIMDQAPEYESGCRTLWKMRDMLNAITLDEMYSIMAGEVPADTILMNVKESRWVT